MASSGLFPRRKASAPSKVRAGKAKPARAHGSKSSKAGAKSPVGRGGVRR